MPRTLATQRTLAGSRYLVRDSWTYVGGADGTANAQVDMGDVLDITTEDFSVALWAKPYGVGAAGSKWLVGKKNGETGGLVGWNIACGASGVNFNDRIRVEVDDGTNRVETTGTKKFFTNTWNHVAVTFDRDGLMSIYLNGVLDTTSSIAAVGSLTNTQPLRFLRDGAGNNRFVGGIDEPRIWKNKILTATEISDLCFKSVVPSGVNGEWLFNEGAGTSATDSSGNGFTGTLSVATFLSDVPFKPRKVVNKNLVTNGGFEFAPPFTAATTTGNRWIDGTAGGSTGANIFAWSFRSEGGTASAKYDSSVFKNGLYSLKLSTLATGSFIEVANYRAAGNPGVGELADLILVKPSTSYTYSFWMKTNVVSGDSNSGASINFNEHSATGGAAVATNATTAIKTTTDWTFYTGTFTTNAATSYIVVDPKIYGHTGAATLIMDAWFDDIVLTPTTPTVRTLVT